MIILVSGGAASGKSALAETLAGKLPGKKFYLATMHRGDGESLRRIARHRVMRAGKGFETVECPLDAAQADVPPDSVCLLECLSNLMANELYDRAPQGDPADKVTADVLALAARTAHLVVVTNEVFSDGAAARGICGDYLTALGRVNRALAARADQVVECVAGLPLYQKGEPR